MQTSFSAPIGTLSVASQLAPAYIMKKMFSVNVWTSYIDASVIIRVKVGGLVSVRVHAVCTYSGAQKACDSLMLAG